MEDDLLYLCVFQLIKQLKDYLMQVILPSHRKYLKGTKKKKKEPVLRAWPTQIFHFGRLIYLSIIIFFFFFFDFSEIL